MPPVQSMKGSVVVVVWPATVVVVVEVVEVAAVVVVVEVDVAPVAVVVVVEVDVAPVAVVVVGGAVVVVVEVDAPGAGQASAVGFLIDHTCASFFTVKPLAVPPNPTQ